ncbi:MAG: winged helix-turn-helix transcriptional regulator [Verrucomicrobiales bacterium]|nr:winged helix-turn-helix transcriptional regulator [Verrucomicrobiales bacterium]MCP5527977.1 winged helix-turn-helix transcriptional regulator [Verrucomicrobiales bacterium]
MTDMSLREFMSLARALADPNRVRLVMVLGEREVCVCHLVEFLGLAPSTVSKHLSILHQARLVNSRKEGRWVYYSLPGREASAEVRDALRWVRQSLQGAAETDADARRLSEVLKRDPSELCKRQCQS